MLKLDETFESLGDLDAHPIEIISGMANGADTLGIKYAKEHKLTRSYTLRIGISIRGWQESLGTWICLLQQHILLLFPSSATDNMLLNANRDEMNPAHTNGKEWNSHHG